MNSVERYYQKKKKRKKRAKFLFFSLLFILMLITLTILSMTVFFNAETIVVEGNSHYTAEELLEQGGLKVGQNLFRLDKFQVITQMEALPYVKNVEIRRRLPNKLLVTVQENQPVSFVESDGRAALLNEDYRVLEFVDIPKERRSADGVTPGSFTIEGVPRLSQVEVTELVVGQSAVFTEDFSGFLNQLYTAFMNSADLHWEQVNEIQLYARYDVRVVYQTLLTIDFGTLDQTDTKLQLAAYLLKDNSSAAKATLDVTNTQRVYYRPET